MHRYANCRSELLIFAIMKPAPVFFFINETLIFELERQTSFREKYYRLSDLERAEVHDSWAF